MIIFLVLFETKVLTLQMLIYMIILRDEFLTIKLL